MKAPACPTCGAPLEARAVVVQAEHGTVHALVEGAPFLTCPEGHVRRDPVARFPEAVVTAVREGLLVAARPRLPWRPQGCGACRHALTMPGRRTTRSVTAAIAGLVPFTVTLDVPLLRCTECGAENLPREVWADVEAAVTAALDEREVGR